MAKTLVHGSIPLLDLTNLEDPDLAWTTELRNLGLRKAGAEPRKAFEALKAAMLVPKSLAGRISKLTSDAWEAYILAGLYLDGQDLPLREHLRRESGNSIDVGSFD